MLPGDHRPLVFIARELVRTNHHTLAQHILTGSLEICATDPGLLNELGVVYQKLGKVEAAVDMFSRAVNALNLLLDGDKIKDVHGKGGGNNASQRTVSMIYPYRRTYGSEVMYNNVEIYKYMNFQYVNIGKLILCNVDSNEVRAT